MFLEFAIPTKEEEIRDIASIECFPTDLLVEDEQKKISKVEE